MSDKTDTSNCESSQAKEDEDFLNASAPSIPLPVLPESGGEVSPSEAAGEEPPPLPPVRVQGLLSDLAGLKFISSPDLKLIS